MRFVTLMITSLAIAALSCVANAANAKTLHFGATEVSFDYQTTKSGSTILALIAQLPESNDLLRGLKNTDQRRLSKLGQLVYQCKLLILSPGSGQWGSKAETPALTSRNFSLFTGVDLHLSVDQRIGIQVNALPAISESSLFNVSLANVNQQQTKFRTLGEGAALNLKQFDLDLVNDSDLFQTSESIEITARFPVFQMEEPVTEWRYQFDLTGFSRAIRYIDDNCTPSSLNALMDGEV